jgi:hypothetical protein
VHEAVAFIREHWHTLFSVPMHPPVHAMRVCHGDATEYTVTASLYPGSVPVTDLRVPLCSWRLDVPKARIEYNELYAHVGGLVGLDVFRVVLLPVLDSQVAMSYLAAGGGPVPALAALAWQHTRLLIERSVWQLKPLWIPSELNRLSDALSRIPILHEAYFPRPAFPGAFAPALRWLHSYEAVSWQLWPAVDAVQVPAAWAFPRAMPLDAVVRQDLALLAAPSSMLARRLLRWVTQHGTRAAVILPFWRDAAWWPLTDAAIARFVISSALTLDQCPVAIYLYSLP